MGKILDPIIDKIVVIVITIVLIKYYEFPWWAVVIFASKDVGLMFIGLFMIGKTNSAIAANFWGKLNLWMQGITIGFYVIDSFIPLNQLKMIFLTFALITTFISAFSYGTIFAKIIRKGVTSH